MQMKFNFEITNICKRKGCSQATNLPCPIRTQGNIERVRVALQRSPQRSAIRHPIALQILERGLQTKSVIINFQNCFY